MAASQHTSLKAFIQFYRWTLLALFGLTPLMAIIYLQAYRLPTHRFEDHTFHLFAISLSILIGLFVCFVAWRCYRETGEVFLRWLAMGFLGFSVVYAPHGLLTPLAHSNPWLFLLYGPASRLVMSICFVLAIIYFGTHPDSPEQRRRLRPWWTALGIFILVDILVFFWAISPLRDNFSLRIGIEYCVIILLALTLSWMIYKKIYNPLMLIYALAMAWFALSSYAFTLAVAWDHQWWLAHVIFAAGFLLLSYGVIQAWLSTRSFSWVFDQAELMEQLRQEKQRAEQAMVDLQYANQQLQKLASTDSLTGIANRRALINRAEQELSHSRRHQHPLSLILLDLDYFKDINDTYGHPVGDAVLCAFVERCKTILRPGDTLGRVGGEEFAILLPETYQAAAVTAAERLRKNLETTPLDAQGKTIPITFSAGVVEFSLNDEVSEEFKRVDKCLYQAKNGGRNQVVAA